MRRSLRQIADGTVELSDGALGGLDELALASFHWLPRSNSLSKLFYFNQTASVIAGAIHFGISWEAAE